LAPGNALVLLLPGLGDALASGPILRGLQRDGWTMDVLLMHPPVREYLEELAIVRNVTELPLRPGVRDAMHAVAELRPRRYDLAILPFPATRWQYQALARGAGARVLVAHAYGGAADLIVRSQRSRRVPLRGGHRIAENLRLAQAAGLTGSSNDLEYWVPDAWRAERTAGLLGVHPGSMAWKGNDAKRWPYENFVGIARRHAASGGTVRFFVGPHEEREATRAADDLRGYAGISIVREPLADAARRLAQCEAFVGNDAGFSHLAAGLGVKTLALYGMTSEVRGAPIGQAIALRPSSCPACHDEGSAGFECVRNIGYRCIARDIEFDDVAATLDTLLAAQRIDADIALEGPYRLYGKAYS
jgi:ADP-heptose:LPS heptosyltransferase